MIQTEKAFDMLPYVAEIYEKLKIQDYINKNFIDKKDDNTTMIAGVNLFVYIMKHSPKIKGEIFNIVALAEEKTVDEIKKQNLTQTLSTFKEIFSDKELATFFKSAMQ